MFDRRTLIILFYVLLPALLGVITRILGFNSGVGDYDGLSFTNLAILQAFGNLVSIVLVYTIFILIVLKPRISIVNKLSDGKIEKKVGKFVVYLQLSLLLFTIFSGFGKAAGEVEIESGLKFIFILFPINYLFLIYFIQSSTDDENLKINSIIYFITSIWQGWAGGVIILLIIAIIKFPQYFTIKRLVLISFILVFSAPLLLALREIIRQPVVSLSLILDLNWLSFKDTSFDELIYSLINRFDLVPATLAFDMFYHGITHGMIFGNICSPWQESIYSIVINKFFSLGKCIAAGEALPSMIQGSYFFYKKTSFSVGTGWIFSSDYLDKIIFMVFALSSLLMARLFAGKSYQRIEIRLLILFATIYLFIPGWYFQFFQFINAFLIYRILRVIALRSNFSFKMFVS